MGWLRGLGLVISGAFHLLNNHIIKWLFRIVDTGDVGHQESASIGEKQGENRGKSYFHPFGRGSGLYSDGDFPLVKTDRKHLSGFDPDLHLPPVHLVHSR